MTKRQLDQIEKVDHLYMKNLFNAKNNVAKEIYYLEAGKSTVKHILISRRLNFLYHILKSNKTGLLHRFQVLEVQLLFSLRSRSYPVKANLKNKYRQNLACFLCNSSSCDQQHLMTCVVLRKFVPDLINTKVKYSDILAPPADWLSRQFPRYPANDEVA